MSGKPLRLPAGPLHALYTHLYNSLGPQQWWPGETPFEIMVGAILTQNTAWSNVEMAIANLRHERCLTPEAIIEVHHKRLAKMLRPSGYFNIKSKRVRNYCKWYQAAGGYKALHRLPTDELRTALLSVNGVGKETADDILLYAFERPVFVIDAYTRRILSRMALIQGDEPYDELRHAVEQALGHDVQLFNEFHALIVCHGKDICRSRPLCGECSLESICAGAVAI